MDRYIIREPKVGTDFPQGNQMIAFSPRSGNNNNNMIPETMYFGGYGAEFPAPQSGFMAVTHVNAPFATNIPNQGQMTSGIDPRYLAAYSDGQAAAFITGQRQQMKRDQNAVPPNGPPFANNYENHGFIGADRRPKTFTPQMATTPMMMSSSRQQPPKTSDSTPPTTPKNIQPNRQEYQYKIPNAITANAPQPVHAFNTSKTELQLPLVKSRAEKIKELHKIGTRAFSGPVEKVLKWHKVLQELGIMVLYEIVAKCVSVRPGEACAKNLVVRDDNGPAIQVVYYEIDFLLPDLQPPCTVRVVGRMMPGTSRLQAFTVRPATGDDVATLPRRAAVAAHHVAKLCKEYGPH